MRGFVPLLYDMESWLRDNCVRPLIFINRYGYALETTYPGYSHRNTHPDSFFLVVQQNDALRQGRIVV